MGVSGPCSLTLGEQGGEEEERGWKGGHWSGTGMVTNGGVNIQCALPQITIILIRI